MGNPPTNPPPIYSLIVACGDTYVPRHSSQYPMEISFPSFTPCGPKVGENGPSWVQPKQETHVSRPSKQRDSRKAARMKLFLHNKFIDLMPHTCSLIPEKTIVLTSKGESQSSMVARRSWLKFDGRSSAVDVPSLGNHRLRFVMVEFDGRDRWI